MKIKKLVSSILIVTFIFAQMVISTYAANSISFAVGSCDAAPGETISIPISLNNNSGFVSMSLSVTYDTSALTLISYEDTGVIAGASHSSHFTSPYFLTWENDTLTSNIISTGTIVYLTFLVSEDAKEQDYSIIVRIPTDGILDANGNAASANSAMGMITVSAEHECSFGDWEYYSKTKHVRYCDGCDEKEYKNHNWNDGKIIEEPSHDEEGEIKYTCEDCDYSYTTEIDPEGHDFGDWTEFSDAQHKRSCSCGDIEYKNHSWGNGVVTKQPTATEAGIRTYTCVDCDATKTESISTDTIVVTGISLNKTSETLNIGDSVSLTANVTPSNATNKNVKWSSLNSSIASVANGVVTAKRAGTATITATTEDGGFVANCVVIVEANPDDSEKVPVVGIEFDKDNVELFLDGEDSTVLTLTILPENATNTEIIWSNSHPSVVDLALFDSENALLVGLSAGTATITATTEDGGFVAQCTIVVLGEKTIVGYKWYSGVLRHKVLYSDGTYDMEDCAPVDCVCGRQYQDSPTDSLIGDINGDGVVTDEDAELLIKYLIDWNVEVNIAALDVNMDGKVNNKDVTRLMQNLAIKN